MRSFFRFLAREGYLPTDPGRDLEPIRVYDRRLRLVLTEEETARVLAAPDTETPLGLRDRAILEVLYSSGVRNSELCALQLHHLDVARHQLRVVAGKGGKNRVVPLGQLALDWTLLYLQKARPLLLRNRFQEHLFLSWRGQPLNRAGLAVLVGKAGEAAGVPRRVTPHVLRHSCATHMLRRRAGLRHIQELLGHSSLETTQVYTRVEISHLQKVHRRFHPREQEL